MKKGVIIAIAVVAVIVLSAISIYNSMVKMDENVTAAWAQVETQYQRRADLIPQLVNVVKGAADYERKTLESVIEARSKATSIQLTADDLTEENLAKFQKAQDQLSSALSHLMAIHEAYPELKANENFRDLQAQLEGTENRIAVARKDFNETVQKYNSYIRRFPKNIFAGMFGFSQKAYFKAAEGAENAPDVNFNFE
ncbi:MAG: LemA family protein [Bacteroidales bacterium]|nr:LemA family protein [Bacteroidales bacterium]MBP5759724.1 LemA family protein [Bacteroidales bacterium]